jgi:hypothetical protein
LAGGGTAVFADAVAGTGFAASVVVVPDTGVGLAITAVFVVATGAVAVGLAMVAAWDVAVPVGDDAVPYATGLVAPVEGEAHGTMLAALVTPVPPVATDFLWPKIDPRLENADAALFTWFEALDAVDEALAAAFCTEVEFVAPAIEFTDAAGSHGDWL